MILCFLFSLIDLNLWYAFDQTFFLSFSLSLFLSFTKTQWYEISNPDICKNTFSLKSLFRNIFENKDKDVYVEGICNTFYCCLHHDFLESLIETFFENGIKVFLNIWNQHEYIITCIISSVVTVPKFQYSVPIPVKIHGSRYQFRYQSKTQKYAN